MINRSREGVCGASTAPRRFSAAPAGAPACSAPHAKAPPPAPPPPFPTTPTMMHRQAAAPAQRQQPHPARSGRRGARSHQVRAAQHEGQPAESDYDSDYDRLRGLRVVAADGFQTELLQLWQPEAAPVVVVPFLTHFSDLSSWEFAQQLQPHLPQLRELGAQVVTVGLGSAENARAFAVNTGFPLDGLYADPTGACYKALGFSPGVAPGNSSLSPYVKLLAMLAGIGSPGTIQEVLRGYVGDRSAPQVFSRRSPFDVLGTGYQRPFELATLRLSNMISILPKWDELSPADPAQLLQQGGTLVFRGRDVAWRHSDSGILKHAAVEELLAVVEQVARGAAGTAAVPAQQPQRVSSSSA